MFFNLYAQNLNLGDVINTISNGDFDNTTYPTGMYVAKNWANNPWGQGYDVCVYIQKWSNRQGGSTTSIKQTAIRHNASIIERWYYNGVWSQWNTNYDTQMLTNSDLLSPLASALGGKSNRLLITKYLDFSSSSTWKEDFYTYYKNELSAYMPYSIVIHGPNWDMVLFGLKCTNGYGFFISLTPYQSEFKYIDIHDGALYENTGK